MSKGSPLKDFHAGNGAEFRELEGWELPLHFGDPLAEYRAVRTGVGALDLADYALIRFSGTDRATFLHGMVSNDVNCLTPGQGCHTAILDVQGKILADLRIFCDREDSLIAIREILKERFLAHLNRYLIADDVEMTDLTGGFSILSLQGPEAAALLQEMLPHSKLPEHELRHARFVLGEIPLHIIASDHTGSSGFDLVVPTGELPQVARGIQETGKKFDCRWVGTEALELLRVETGIPRYGTDMNEENLLLETGLDRAVSFNKGCYLGQEVVERIRSRGHVNKRLMGLILDGNTPAGPGDPVWRGDERVGTITSSIVSPALKRAVALGYLNKNFLAPGTQVSVEHAGSKIAAEVAAAPFVKPR